MDTFTPEKRSQIMGRIRSNDTKPELAVRRLLHRSGFRFRLHGAKLPGKPDIVLPRYRTVIFVHGCFWHAHACQRGRIPKGNIEYWRPKLEGNARRDAEAQGRLRLAGWDPIVVWACDLKDVAALEQRLRAKLQARLGELDAVHKGGRLVANG